MPASLVTEFKCIATSGPTVDGREIQSQWLTDMAETYNPATYTAKLWIDHMRYASYGAVRELKAEEVDGTVKLYGRISPTRDLLQMNQVWEEYLHFSIEVTEDFAGTGKTYLTGLAMTDQPASLGTDEMRFSAMPGRKFTARYAGEVVPDLRGMDEEERFTKTFFKKLYRVFKDETKEDETGDDPMDKEQFDAVKDTLEATQQSVTTLAETMNGFMEKLGKGETPGGEGAEGSGEGDGEAGTPAEADQFAVLQTSVKTMTDAFTTMTERMEKAVPGTFARENHGPAGDQDTLC